MPNVASKEKYVSVTAFVTHITADAIQVDQIGRADPPVWIPRSLIHTADDLKISRLNTIEELTFRLMEWKAKALGL